MLESFWNQSPAADERITQDERSDHPTRIRRAARARKLREDNASDQQKGVAFFSLHKSSWTVSPECASRFGKCLLSIVRLALDSAFRRARREQCACRWRAGRLHPIDRRRWRRTGIRCTAKCNCLSAARADAGIESEHAFPVLFGKNGSGMGQRSWPGKMKAVCIRRNETAARRPASFGSGKSTPTTRSCREAPIILFIRSRTPTPGSMTSKSPNYNRFVTIDDPGDPPPWFEKQKMRHNDFAYRWLVEIRHNSDPPVPGRRERDLFSHSPRREPADRRLHHDGGKRSGASSSLGCALARQSLLCAPAK